MENLFNPRQGTDSKREWSKYQLAIFANFEDDEGHTVIEAVAGSGKTTTVVEGTTKVPRDRKVMLCAFNKSIQKELQKKVHRSIDVRTLHSLGMLACRRAFGDITIDENKGKNLARQVCLERGFSFKGKRDGEMVPLNWRNVMKLADRAKNTLTSEDDTQAMMNLAIDHDLDDSKDMQLGDLVVCAREAVKLAAEDTLTLDFDDMVWFPARHSLRPASHDLVVVDETQDLNAAQLYLAQATCRRNGRIVAVGDRHQAIYRFRGADEDAIPRMIDELKATTLPLSISYRCPLKVVRLAQEVVPHFEARPGAPEGLVAHVEELEMRKAAKPGDLVLSRKKAPLLRLALGFLAQGIPACVLGRDIGKDLVSMMGRAKTEDVGQMNKWVESWGMRETSRLKELERDDKIEEVNDTVQTIMTLSEGQKSVAQVVHRTEQLFRDDDPMTRIVCSTVHKAKGLERDRVWMIGDTFRLWSGPKYQEERNLYYVAVTRAKSELYIVGEVSR